MKVMVIVKANADTEAGVMPSEQELVAMSRFNELLVKAGVMLAGEGLKPSSRGARIAFDGAQRRGGVFANDAVAGIGGHQASKRCRGAEQRKGTGGGASLGFEFL